MITDNETNILYFSRLLTSMESYWDFWQRLEKILINESMPYAFIDNSSDIWCRDYMPVQISENAFVQFRYLPSYCNNKKWEHTITNPSKVMIDQEIKAIKSELIIDGGNFVKAKNHVIMTERVIEDNRQYTKDFIIEECKRLLQVDTIDIIPQAPHDYTGHADGMVRFLNDEILLVADYSYEKDYWKRKYSAALNHTGLNIISFPGFSSDVRNKDNDLTAIGCYINFARIGNIILLPQFNCAEDSNALMETEKLFPGCKVIPVLSNEIAVNGGVFNCITWNVFR